MQIIRFVDYLHMILSLIYRVLDHKVMYYKYLHRICASQKQICPCVSHLMVRVRTQGAKVCEKSTFLSLCLAKEAVSV
jgi:hypothetical protein